MKYIIAVFGIFALMILGVILFTRGGSNKKKPETKVVQLTDYVRNTEASVQFTIEGPINANEVHQALRVSITPQNRNIDIIRGYQGEVIKSQSYDNNVDAFEAFMEALNRAGFTRKIETKAVVDSICPTGTRTYFDLLNSNEKLINTWTASCSKGTFGGNLALTRQLFQAQIPDYTQFTSNVTFTTGTSGSTGLTL